MIVFDRVSYVSKVAGVKRTVLSQVSIGIPSDRRIALLGPSEEDKRIVVNLLAGVMQPTAGRIMRKARMSFPTGNAGAFAPDLSVRRNVDYVARLYGANVPEVVGFVERILNLGAAFDEPYARLPPDIKRIFGQIVACSIPFDVYVMNQMPKSVPKEISGIANALFEERARTSGIILAERNTKIASQYCEMALVVQGNQMVLFDDMDRAAAALKQAKASAP